MATMVLISFSTALLAELSGATLGFGPAILYEAWTKRTDRRVALSFGGWREHSEVF